MQIENFMGKINKVARAMVLFSVMFHDYNRMGLINANVYA